MSLHFKVTKQKVGFLDPFNKFEPKHLEVEVRQDPLTGDIARVLEFRARDLGEIDHSEYLGRNPGIPCPFCPENMDRMAAKFLPEEAPEGRLKAGQAVCFPNAFPYEAMNAVVVLTKAHYLQPGQFTVKVIADGLWLSRLAFSRLAKGLKFGSVNWNYMMPAGAGLIHPHFQIAGGKSPTRFQSAMLSKARGYARQNGGDLAKDYLDAARKEKSRWLGRLGPAGWVTPFAPRAIYDVMALVPGGRGLMEMKRPQVERLAEGVKRVLDYFQAKGIAAYNMTLHTGLQSGTGLPTMLRLVSRIDIPPMGVDEINYFEKLHDEMVTFIKPEHTANQLREFWK